MLAQPPSTPPTTSTASHDNESAMEVSDPVTSPRKSTKLAANGSNDVTTASSIEENAAATKESTDTVASNTAPAASTQKVAASNAARQSTTTKQVAKKHAAATAPSRRKVQRIESEEDHTEEVSEESTTEESEGESAEDNLPAPKRIKKRNRFIQDECEEDEDNDEEDEEDDESDDSWVVADDVESLGGDSESDHDDVAAVSSPIKRLSSSSSTLQERHRGTHPARRSSPLKATRNAIASSRSSTARVTLNDTRRATLPLPPSFAKFVARHESLTLTPRLLSLIVACIAGVADTMCMTPTDQFREMSEEHGLRGGFVCSECKSHEYFLHAIDNNECRRCCICCSMESFMRSINMRLVELNAQIMYNPTQLEQLYSAAIPEFFRSMYCRNTHKP